MAENQDEYFTLHIRDEVMDGVPVMTSAWEFTPAELATLNAGGKRALDDCRLRASARNAASQDKESDWIMRLHSVRFKRAPYSTADAYKRSEIVRDLCTLYGCYLERVFATNDPSYNVKWMARYE
jgi:hypothetical protein